MAKTYAWPWQNPSYPENRDLTPDEMEQWARDASMARAQSPNPLVCKIDGKWSIDDPFHHHGFDECMNYRHANVIGDGDPWTNWWLLDDAQITPRPPLPSTPIGIEGWQLRASAIDPTIGLPGPPPPVTPPVPVWQLRAQVNISYGLPIGTPLNDSWEAGYQGLTIAQRISASAINPVDAGLGFRIGIIGAYTITKCFVGPLIADGTWVAASLQQLTFNGGNTVVTGDMTRVFFSDPLPQGIDGSNGLLLTCYLDPGGYGTVGGGIKEHAGGWSVRVAAGDFAANLDKSDGTVYIDPDNDLASLLFIEVDGLYLPPKSAGPTP